MIICTLRTSNNLSTNYFFGLLGILFALKCRQLIVMRELIKVLFSDLKVSFTEDFHKPHLKFLSHRKVV